MSSNKELPKQAKQFKIRIKSKIDALVNTASDDLPVALICEGPSGRTTYFGTKKQLIVTNRTIPQYDITWRDSLRDLGQYTTIKSKKQRWIYVTEYKLRYPEYKQLYCALKLIWDRFKQLAEALQKLNPKSEEYKNMQKLILQKYKAVKENVEYRSLSLRFYLLQRKLAHIKLLILLYDLQNVFICN